MRTLSKNLISLSLIAMALSLVTNAEAANKAKKMAPKAPVAPPVSQNTAAHQQLTRALDLAGKGQYQPAASQLFSLSRRAELKADRPQIKYILGLMLMELFLRHTMGWWRYQGIQQMFCRRQPT